MQYMASNKSFRVRSIIAVVTLFLRYAGECSTTVAPEEIQRGQVVENIEIADIFKVSSRNQPRRRTLSVLSL